MSITLHFAAFFNFLSDVKLHLIVSAFTQYITIKWPDNPLAVQ